MSGRARTLDPLMPPRLMLASRLRPPWASGKLERTAPQAKMANLARDRPRALHRFWLLKHKSISEANQFLKICPRALSGRWNSVTSVERFFMCAGRTPFERRRKYGAVAKALYAGEGLSATAKAGAKAKAKTLALAGRGRGRGRGARGAAGLLIREIWSGREGGGGWQPG